MELLVAQRTAAEQRIRYESYSGLTEVRGFMTGTQPYHQQLYERLWGQKSPFYIFIIRSFI
jgi:hypothetical protein